MRTISSPLRLSAGFVLLTLVAGAALLLVPSSGSASSCVLPDLPSCACFDSVAAWPLSGPAGDLAAVGKQMIGTKPSCITHGGQAYWQIQLQLTYPLLAEFVAAVNPGYQTDHAPEAWCTESVAYWGLVAGLPYDRGFANPLHHPSSYVRGSNEMRRWFETEEALGGRGRWIDGQELDYDDFFPGINAPCPGAYQQIYYWDPNDNDGDGNLWDGNIGHSQVVDSMVVYRLGGQDGTIQKIDLHYVEGNAGSPAQVINDRWYRGIRDFTLLGPDNARLDTSGRKIRGWGIILNQYGTPVCDWSKMTTVITPVFRAPHTPLGPDDSDSLMVARMVAYAVATQGGLNVTSNSKLVQASGWPTETNPWVIPQGQHPVNPLTIRFDLGAEHPLPMRGVTVCWKDAVPPRFQVRWEDGSGSTSSRVVTLGQAASPPPGTIIPLRTAFQSGQEFPVRAVALAFQLTDLSRTYIIQGLDFEYFDGEYEDDNLSSPGGDAALVGVPGRGGTLDLRLGAGHPNPVRSTAGISFHLPGAGSVTLEVYDVRGGLVRTLVDELLPEGDHEARWDGTTTTGRVAAGGVYLVRLVWNGEARTTRLVRLP